MLLEIGRLQIRKVVCSVGAISLLFLGFMLIAGPSTALAQAFSEGFAVVPVPGWTVQNNSVPVGSTGWFQGNSTVFPAQAGPATSYIGANFNNTTGTNTISNWLITPQRSLSNGDVVKFWTRTTTANPFPDRLQVRLSLAGASTNVGSGPTGLGDFTTLLLDINPTYGGDYPEVWTEFTITLSGIPPGASGRFAFRYFVEMGGPTGDNSNYIGIDTFSYTPGGPAVVSDAPVDFNGDGRTDWVVARNSGGASPNQIRWFWNTNGAVTPTQASDWGLNTDVLVPADYDSDDKDDIAIWRPGAAGVAAFYILNSATLTARVELFGQTGDNPTVVNDYNGDTTDDIAVYRGGAQSVWYYRTTPNGPITFIQWGTTGDFVAPGDYNGDGTADFGIQRDNAGAGNFWIRLSTGVVQPVVSFGLSSDLVYTGDFDGDAKTDIAVARSVGGNRNWYWRPSSGGADQQVTFGLATDVIAPGDYNGDARADLAVFRSGVFYVYSPTGGTVSFFTLGAAGDRLPAGYNVH